MRVMRKQTKILGGRMKLKLMVGVCFGILPRKFEKIETHTCRKFKRWLNDLAVWNP
jgi:hypothetical protein